MGFCCSGWFRGRSVGGRGVRWSPRLLVGEYGDHVLVEEVLESHRLVAVWTWAADVDAAGEDAAGWAAVVPGEAVPRIGGPVNEVPHAGFCGRCCVGGPCLLCVAV